MFLTWIDAMVMEFKQNGKIGIIYIDAIFLDDVDAQYGRGMYHTVLKTLRRIFDELKETRINGDDIIAVDIPLGHKYFIFLTVIFIYIHFVFIILV